jgi:hypothetical protein
MPIDIPADHDAFKAEVLSDQDDDDQGVYEVWWLATARYPDLPSARGYQLPRQWCATHSGKAESCSFSVIGPPLEVSRRP